MMKLNEKDAIKAAKTIFPKADNAKEIDSGYGHQVFIVNTNDETNQIILRFGNNNKEKYSLSKEIRVMNLLSQKNIPVPEVIAHDDTRKIVNQEFMIMSVLEGEDLDKVFDKMSKDEQSTIALQLGEILGKIHTIKFESYGQLTATGIDKEKDFSTKTKGTNLVFDPCIRNFLEDSMHDLGSMYAFKNPPIKVLDAVYHYLIENRDLAKETEKPSLIHGDFEIRNVRVKKTSKGWTVTGIIDFELAASHAKEYDFIKLQRYGLLDKAHFKKSLLKGYTKYQKMDKNFDKKISYFRIGRDVGFIFTLYKAGDIAFANKILKSVAERICLKSNCQ